ncbi:MAG TPA: MgtC/SapB family protein [Candidatus Omnitrophota bacterium]|nr:MgtC/SapB family protein [Candidatus Omnitrophota bacterium]HPD85276.1 MgtC/SapB family protein [Candidatus Omnitrophota bacterium]HRZ04223.1 MgtC/SapB family protein [Candidatus Omnitrophota bacterium]
MSTYEWDTISKVVLTILLSGLIGAEREIRHKGAGLRTHILVGVGSALIVLTSFHISDTYKNVTFIDPTRMIAGVVTGIGFLCAGTIILQGNTRVIGLTTAASLWIVSGVGIAIASGHYIGGITVALLVFSTLVWLKPIERVLANRFGSTNKGGENGNA